MEENLEEQKLPQGHREQQLQPDSLPPKVTEERVWSALRECYDPEIPVNIVDLGLVYDVKLEEEITGEANVYVRMTLTAPGCGMGPMIAADVRRKVLNIRGIRNAMVDLVFDPIWNPSMMSEAAKLMLNMQ